MRRWIRACVAGAVLCSTLWMGGCRSQEVSLTVCDAAGNPMAQIQDYPLKAKHLTDAGQWAYIDVVLDEATLCLQQTYGGSIEEAQDRLLHSGYTIHTNFDTACYAAMRDAYAQEENAPPTFAAAMTDLHGRVLAVYSVGEKESNYAKQALAPYSAFKPLSVYAPAIEAGVARWSSLYEDSPYKQITGEDGKKSDWPVNANGVYTMQGEGLLTAVKQSLNTVAVKCLADLSAEASLRFLREQLGLTLEYEQKKLVLQGQEEVIGNIAMGYLQQGVTPIQMAGYYQMFANGGVYTAPYTVSRVTDADGETVYEASPTEKQAISASTAYIMNQLLQGVVHPDGTGAAAYLADVPVGGKTGTGSADDGNWFVGFTPQHACAVWHGHHEGNRAAAMFADIVADTQDDSGRQAFPTCRQIKQVAYCRESGKQLTAACRSMNVGYYDVDDALPLCDVHTDKQ